MREVSRQEVQDLMRQGVQLVDVLPTEEFQDDHLPGAIHLPTIPAHRKWNRIDLGTADKVCSAALCIVDQASRLGVAYEETSFIMLELGGGFSAALAIDRGQIVDGLGGSCAPIGGRSCGALDAEVAYLLGAALTKDTVFSGGALDPRGKLDLSAPGAFEALRGDPSHSDGWLALEEGAVKAALALTVSVPSPREILVAGRLAGAPGLLDAWQRLQELVRASLQEQLEDELIEAAVRSPLGRAIDDLPEHLQEAARRRRFSARRRPERGRVRHDS